MPCCPALAPGVAHMPAQNVLPQVALDVGVKVIVQVHVQGVAELVNQA